MISFCLIILAAISNAIMDVISFHFGTSVFSKLNAQFWNPELSWKNKYVNNDPLQGRRKLIFGINTLVQLSDSWHFFKASMLIFIIAAIAFYTPVVKYYDFLLIGTLYNITFSFFYNTILRKK